MRPLCSKRHIYRLKGIQNAKCVACCTVDTLHSCQQRVGSMNDFVAMHRDNKKMDEKKSGKVADERSTNCISQHVLVIPTLLV